MEILSQIDSLLEIEKEIIFKSSQNGSQRAFKVVNIGAVGKSPIFRTKV